MNYLLFLCPHFLCLDNFNEIAGITKKESDHA